VNLLYEQVELIALLPPLCGFILEGVKIAIAPRTRNSAHPLQLPHDDEQLRAEIFRDIIDRGSKA
jgi:hypothetical protein